MLSQVFYRWERKLASVDRNRMVRPFEWGLDWIPDSGLSAHQDASLVMQDYVAGVMKDSDAWYAVEPARQYGTAPLPRGAEPGERMVTFDSAYTTPHPENNTVYTRYFPAPHLVSHPSSLSPNSRAGHPAWLRCSSLKYSRYARSSRLASRAPRSGTSATNHWDGTLAEPDGRSAPRRAVVVMAQWNADEDGHVGLCRLLNRFGISALRLSLPYHDRRKPPELARADYIVSSNVGRTLQVCRQAVLDAKRAIAWLHQQGYHRIGMLGTSIGSCLAMLTGAHEPLVNAMALNHVSPWFADVIWEGLSTGHVRAGLEDHISLTLLRDLWGPISPQSYVDKIGRRPSLLVYALFDLSFPLHLSRDVVRAYRTRNIPAEVRVLPCGHYTTGIAPFKYLDGYYLASFLRRRL